jgi:DNA-binding Lrp family transcriptional regulator
MDLQGQRDLQLLNEVEQDSHITQRSLADKMGVALGLTNLYLKRLAHKGYIKITTIPSHRIKYLLTPRGMAEKSRLTYAYMQYSLSYYREMRQRLKQVLVELSQSGAKRIVVYGTGELAELAYLTLREMDLTLVGFVDGAQGQTFLSYPLWPVEALSNWNYDSVLIADLTDTNKIHARLLRAGVPQDKIVTIGPRQK